MSSKTVELGHVDLTIQDGKLVSRKNGFQVSKQTHEGTAFVNSSMDSTMYQHRPKRRERLLTRRRYNVRFDFDMPKGKAQRESQSSTDRGQGRGNKTKRVDARKTPKKKLEKDNGQPAFLLAASSKSSNDKTARSPPLTPDMSLFKEVPRALADWMVHQLPTGVSFTETSRVSLRFYLDLLPRRTYPWEMTGVITHNPLRTPTTYESLFQDAAILQCALSVGAVSEAVRYGVQDSAAATYHSGKLYTLINAMLGEPLVPARRQILLQSVATLGYTAHLTGQYNQWQVHIKGLKLIVESGGDDKSISPATRWIMHKADMNGAAEQCTCSYLLVDYTHQHVFDIIPLEMQVYARGVIERALSPCCSDEKLLEILVSSGLFSIVLDLARSQRAFKLDPESLMQDFYYYGNQYINYPRSLHDFSIPRDEARRYLPSIESALRISAMLYAKRINPDRLDLPSGHPVVLTLLSRHLRVALTHIRRTASPNNEFLDPQILSADVDSAMAARGKPLVEVLRPALIWLSLLGWLVGEQTSWQDNGLGHDRPVYRDILLDVVGPNADDVRAVPEEDFDLCRVFNLKALGGKARDFRGAIIRIVEDG